MEHKKISTIVDMDTYKKLKYVSQKCGISVLKVINAYIQSVHNAFETLGEIEWLRDSRMFRGLDQEQILKKFFSLHHIITSLENMEEIQEKYRELKAVLQAKDN